MSKFIFSFTVIFSGLFLGYAVQQGVAKGWIRLPVSIETLRKTLQKSALLGVLPITILGAIWVAEFHSPSIAALPLLGFCAIMLGGVCALAAARFLRLPAHKTGALYACGSFTNIGSIGALICFVFLGEGGFALVPIYKIFEELTYYAIGFPIAKYYSAAETGIREKTFDRLKALPKDPFILVALSSIALGGMLNVAGIPRPSVFKAINAVCIPLGTSMLLVSIGLAMRFKSVRHYLRECVAVGSIKFIIVPLSISSVAFLMGYGEIDGGLPLKVVIILTSMPVAFNALIPPSIYDLDLDLANSCWFFTTACLVFVLPLLLIILQMI